MRRLKGSLKQIKRCASAGLVLCLCAASGRFALADTRTDAGAGDGSSAQKSGAAMVYDYLDALREYEQAGFAAVPGVDITVTLDSIVGWDAGQENISEMDGVPGAMTDENHRYVEFAVEIPESGLYVLGAAYAIPAGSGLNAVRQVTVDGESPFDEMDKIPFYRNFESGGAPRVNSLGDEVSPTPVEAPGWQTALFTDNMAKYSEPMQVYLEAGRRILRFTYVDQPLLLREIYIRTPVEAPAYADAVLDRENGAPAGYIGRFEAEKVLDTRSDSAIGLQSDGDPKASPPSIGYIRLNSVGGFAYRTGGQRMDFVIDGIPEAGYYALNFRSRQSWNGNLPSYRRLSVNGEVPYAECQAIPFRFDRNWVNTIPGGEDTPMLFWLEKGTNTISLTAVLGEYTVPYKLVGEGLNELSAIIREILMITTSNPDPNYDYELPRVMPDLADRLNALADKLEQAEELLNENSIKKDSVTGNNLESIYSQLREMAENTEKIPRRLSDLNNMSSLLGTMVTEMPYQPLSLDYIEVYAPDVTVSDERSNFIDNIVATCKSFYYSFVKDYNGVASYSGSEEQDKTIRVWINRGREWATILKELTDSEFSPQYGINIQLSIMPASQMNSTTGSISPLLLAISAGNAPDVAMSVASNIPVEYAFRDAIVDLSAFPGFEEVKSRFLPQLMVPMEYGGKTYGLPEQMYFRGLFYRSDILEELGIPVPQTWKQVQEETLPKLYENGMEMYVPAWPDMFILSQGGSYYNEDGSRSALDTEEAYEGFKAMCDMYTVYGVPTSASFFNRFRTAEMPIGVEGTGMYLQLIAAAPDLAGRWDMALIPGFEQEDGSIQRSSAGYTGEALVILESSQNKEESYQFLEWWTRQEVQSRFALQVEGRIGPQARWLTSNMEAFQQLAWDKDDLEVILQTWDCAEEIPNVPGGYFSSRHLGNAFNRVVVGGMDVRSSLEKCVKDINKEIIRKRQQMGLE
jgi:extracellular solute-binding protein family 1